MSRRIRSHSTPMLITTKKWAKRPLKSYERKYRFRPPVNQPLVWPILAELLPPARSRGLLARVRRTCGPHIIGCREIVIGEGFLLHLRFAFKTGGRCSAAPILFAVSPIF